MGDKNNNPQYKGEVKREYILFGDYILEGLGSLTSTDGEKYVGEWKDNKFHGQGTETWSDGRKYVGEFKNGGYEGQGTETWKDGTKYVGEYKYGIEWNGTQYDKNGNIKYKYVNGKQIKQ